MKTINVTTETEDILWGLLTGIAWTDGENGCEIDIQNINFETKSVTLIDKAVTEDSIESWNIPKRNT